MRTLPLRPVRLSLPARGGAASARSSARTTAHSTVESSLSARRTLSAWNSERAEHWPPGGGSDGRIAYLPGALSQPQRSQRDCRGLPTCPACQPACCRSFIVLVSKMKPRMSKCKHFISSLGVALGSADGEDGRLLRVGVAVLVVRRVERLRLHGVLLLRLRQGQQHQQAAVLAGEHQHAREVVVLLQQAVRCRVPAVVVVEVRCQEQPSVSEYRVCQCASSATGACNKQLSECAA